MGIGGSAPATLLKSPREIDIMARGGALLYATLQHMKAHVRPGISTGELDALCEAFIRSHAGAEPAFKGLYGFPGSACISINEEVVHGIPSRKRVLHDGDIVKLDFGVNRLDDRSLCEGRRNEDNRNIRTGGSHSFLDRSEYWK